MANGGIDVFASRRGYYYRCRWWRTSEAGSVPVRDIEHLGTPAGVFYAKPSSTHYESDDAVASAFMFDGNDITITTQDNVNGIEPHCTIEYDGRVWIVQDVQRKPVLKTAQVGRARYVSFIKLHS